MYYDKSGNKIDMQTCAFLGVSKSYRRVAKTQLDGVLVSTVWLGIDHNWGEGPPLIFETMAFFVGSKGEDNTCERYATETEAIAGHSKIVAEYIAKGHKIAEVET